MAAIKTNKRGSHKGDTVASSHYEATTASVTLGITPMITPRPRAIKTNGTGTIVTMDEDGDVSIWPCASTGFNIVPFSTCYLPAGTQTDAQGNTGSTTYSSVTLLF